MDTHRERSQMSPNRWLSENTALYIAFCMLLQVPTSARGAAMRSKVGTCGKMLLLKRKETTGRYQKKESVSTICTCSSSKPTGSNIFWQPPKMAQLASEVSQR